MANRARSSGLRRTHDSATARHLDNTDPGSPSEPASADRVVLSFTGSSAVMLNQIIATEQALGITESSKASMVGRALRLYAWYLDVRRAGGELLHQRQDGRVSAIEFLMG